GFVKFNASAKAGQNVARRASDSRTGQVLIAVGSKITPAEVAWLAGGGCVSVPVRKLPAAEILGTGDEIVEPHETPGPAQIRNSNSPELLAQCAAQHIRARYLGRAPDDREATKKLIGEGLGDELFVSTG